MADYVTAAGLSIKTVEQILDELSARQKAEIDATLNTAPDSPVGQLNGIFASQLREVWEVLAVAYNGFNPDAAEGFLLEKLSALTGTVKRPATKSTVSLTCDLDLGTTLIAGTHFAHVVGAPDNRWTPEADYTAPGAGVQTVDFEAETAGELRANAGTLTVIATAVTGWNSVTNATDATVGREADTDSDLRQRREDELRASGSATVDAIRADLLQYEDANGDQLITQASVFENVTDTVDANGLPPHSLECVVYDGTPPALTDDEIAQAIFDTKPAGILAYGLESGTAIDSLGNFHTVGFSRPTEVEIWLRVDVNVDQVTGYAGADALKASLVLLNDTHLLVGRDLFVQVVSAVAIGFDGIYDVGAVYTGLASPAADLWGDVVIGPRQLGRLDTGRIIVNETIGPIP